MILGRQRAQPTMSTYDGSSWTDSAQAYIGQTSPELRENVRRTPLREECLRSFLKSDVHDISFMDQTAAAAITPRSAEEPSDLGCYDLLLSTRLREPELPEAIAHAFTHAFYRLPCPAVGSNEDCLRKEATRFCNRNYRFLAGVARVLYAQRAQLSFAPHPLRVPAAKPSHHRWRRPGYGSRQQSLFESLMSGA